ncbi:MAG: ubiquinone/menaquinone biosynthesis methyltransferase [candidate division Zixibacteria bacterium RBG-1]|nr:MAG: ubiquinone/menaquinone biosynthesis methyltransferase [candidate division Zixibacteria bacterium RBG-1]
MNGSEPKLSKQVELMVTDYNQHEKKSFVRKMFSDIAPDYDHLNRIISFNLDFSWRKKSTENLEYSNLVLDLCAGTGDMASALFSHKNFKGKIILCDFSYEMLVLARKKLQNYGEKAQIYLVCGDVEKLPFKAEIFDGMMLGFSLRNLESQADFYSETKRVLQKGGTASFLEIAHPENILFSRVFYLYFYKWVPFISQFFTKRKYAYKYLPDSLKIFPKQKEVVKFIKTFDFEEVTYHNVMGGMAAVYKLVK